MRAVVQRVARAAVLVSQERRAAIGPGLLVLLGVREGDEEKDAIFLAKKIAHLRVFEDEAGKFNRSLLEVQGEALVVPQFTLYGDCRKGRRPSFIQAAQPPLAERLYEGFVEVLRAEGVPTKTGVFGARMDVELTNQGPCYSPSGERILTVPLKDHLDSLYRTFDRRFLSPDPLEVVHRYRRPEDREVVGFLASALAYGHVDQILKASIGPSP